MSLCSAATVVYSWPISYCTIDPFPHWQSVLYQAIKVANLIHFSYARSIGKKQLVANLSVKMDLDS